MKRIHPLTRKLLRDLWRLKLQVGAVAMLIACGVAVTVMSYSALKSLEQARTRYYAETRFADAFVSLKRAPLAVARRIAALPGVVAVEPRVVKAGLLKVPSLVRPAAVRLVSLPDPKTGLDRIVIRQGRLPAPGRSDEAVALETFLHAAGLHLGDRLPVIVSGRRIELKIVGAALAPEYVYVPSPDSTMPDDAHQGVMWMDRRTLERVADMGGAFNDLVVDLGERAPLGALLTRMDSILAPYGAAPAYGRRDQVSNAYLESEFKQLHATALAIPPLFLLVAAGMVNLVVGRLVDAEREHIGLLKAFGYSDARAAANYVALALAIGAIGVVAGGLLGAELGSAMTRLYQQYMRFPALTPRLHYGSLAASGAAGLAAALAGSLLSVRRVLRLQPAIAMQALRPASYGKGPLDRLAPRLDQPTRMILRGLERFPARAAATFAGLCISLGLLVSIMFLFDSLERVIQQTYYRAQRWSDSVGFGEVRDVRAVAELRRFTGVFKVEPIRVASARIIARGRTEQIGVFGLEPDATLDRPLDVAGRAVPFKGRNLILSQALARKLGVRPGQDVRIEISEGRRSAADLTVAATIEDYTGFAAYMPRRQLNRLLGEGDTASGAQLLIAPDRRGAFYRAVTKTPWIAAASSRDETVARWRSVIAKSFRTTIFFYIGFAAAIAVAVAYNMSRISLAERTRDLATLHVLGFSHGDCAYILIGELGLLSLLAIAPGVVIGRLLAEGLAEIYSNQQIRMIVEGSAASSGVAIAIFLAAIAIAAAGAAQRVWTLDLVGALKTRE